MSNMADHIIKWVSQHCTPIMFIFMNFSHQIPYASSRFQTWWDWWSTKVWLLVAYCYIQCFCGGLCWYGTQTPL